MSSSEIKMMKMRILVLTIMCGLALIVLPYLFINKTWFYTLESEKAYQIGGAINGLTAPILGVIIALVTYLAFYMQWKANKQITIDMKTGRIETQFYQMLKLHRENVRGFRYIAKDNTEQDLKGREAFDKLKSIVRTVYDSLELESPKEKIKVAYDTIFLGDKNYGCSGHAVEIAHYIRQLFHTVKFIANNNEIKAEQKHEYLRQLRVQMSTDEQILLFYNWYSDRGQEWENDNNSFLSKYRMIHNIFPDRMPEEIMKLLLNKQIPRVEYGRNELGNSIFEFQDWKDYVKINK